MRKSLPISFNNNNDMQQKIIILDFGSQTTQLIGRRVRELDTFCEILPYNKFPKDDASVIGVILSGSPYSVHDAEAFRTCLDDFVGRIPVLGICYGAQFIANEGGGRVEAAGPPIRPATTAPRSPLRAE